MNTLVLEDNRPRLELDTQYVTLVVDSEEAELIIEDARPQLVLDSTDVVLLEVGQQGVQGIQGIQGIQGNPGLNGSGDKNYIHIQSLASTIWTVNHGLGKYPSIEVIDSGDNVVIGNVSYIDTNNLTVEFSAPFGGKAVLN